MNALSFKLTCILFFLLQTTTIFAQGFAIEGVLTYKNSDSPVAFKDVLLFHGKDTVLTKTDYVGKFFFWDLSKDLYRIYINGNDNAAYKDIDSSFTLKSSTKMILKLEINTKIKPQVLGLNKKKAETDIKKENIILFIPCSLTTIFYPPDASFEKKYNVRMISYSCTLFPYDNYAEYNQTVFAYLDKKYGTKWRKEVRPDVIGLK